MLSIMHEIAAIDPPPPSKVRPELPREFDLIIECALAKDKEQRYSSAAELGDALRNLRTMGTISENQYEKITYHNPKEIFAL